MATTEGAEAKPEPTSSEPEDIKSLVEVMDAGAIGPEDPTLVIEGFRPPHVYGEMLVGTDPDLDPMVVEAPTIRVYVPSDSSAMAASAEQDAERVPTVIMSSEVETVPEGLTDHDVHSSDAN